MGWYLAGILLQAGPQKGKRFHQKLNAGEQQSTFLILQCVLYCTGMAVMMKFCFRWDLEAVRLEEVAVQP